MPCLASSIVLSQMLNCPPFWRCTWTLRNILSRLGKRKWLKVVSTDYLNVNRPTRSHMDTTTSRQHAKNTDLIQYWMVRRAHIYRPKQKRRLTCILCALSVWCGWQFTRKRGRWSACEHKHTRKRRAAGTSALKVFFWEATSPQDVIRCRALWSLPVSQASPGFVWTWTVSRQSSRFVSISPFPAQACPRSSLEIKKENLRCSQQQKQKKQKYCRQTIIFDLNVACQQHLMN